MKIFIGNFCEGISQDQLRERLEEFGQVESVRIENKMAFAEMPFKSEAESAIINLDKSVLDGITLSVHKARFSKTERRKVGRGGGRRSQDVRSYSKIFSRKDIFI